MSLLTDRLLSGGGCNYGNTIVLGQELLPHVQPTGLALLALAGEADRDGRIGRSLDYLSAVLSEKTTSASLAYGLLGLAAHGRFPAYADRFLVPAYRRTLQRDGAAYQLALLGLAARRVGFAAGRFAAARCETPRRSGSNEQELTISRRARPARHHGPQLTFRSSRYTAPRFDVLGNRGF